ncbi:MAG TPA: LLM class flavin-dependent oxidoreductase [Rhizomicrobium sp.]|jgi:alkanesulfonate monooxygenase SsuD/methylene tetrahydromethanopterin reductase-like flavin-dependent oxidoreductase (luciferase family)|nr:LLM class flavin-dependent oxidoreductase [Rhizomicrobium sp.]
MPADEEPRRATNPLFNDNKLKLGLFGYNGNGPQMTAAAERFVINWPRAADLARHADRMGLEAQVSFCVWRHPISGNADHLAHREFEPFTWCAAIGATAPSSAVVATFHAQLTNPAFVAKAATTIDHLTGGRVGLNIVAGNSRSAFDQFGQEVEDPETRYAHAAEFLEILKRFWHADEEFDFDGRFHRVRKGISRPRPVQAPFPAIMNAGISERGMRFATKYADLAFTLLGPDPASWEPQIQAYHRLAREEYGRAIQVWTHAYVVIAETEREAEGYVNSYAVERADHAWVKAWTAEITEHLPALRSEHLVALQRNWAAGGGFPLVGTPDTIVALLERLSQCGLGGVLLTALEPETMLARWDAEIMPRLEQAELRKSRHAPPPPEG